MYPGDLSLIAYLVVWSVEGLFAHYYAEKSVLLDIEGQKKSMVVFLRPHVFEP